MGLGLLGISTSDRGESRIPAAVSAFGVVLRAVRDPSQAEEVTQEVYLEIWWQAKRYDPARGSAISWLTTMAHRRAVDRVRNVEASRRRDQNDQNDHARCCRVGLDDAIKLRLSIPTPVE